MTQEASFTVKIFFKYRPLALPTVEFNVGLVGTLNHFTVEK